MNEAGGDQEEQPAEPWGFRWALLIIGVVIGAATGGPAGILGGALLGALAEICTWEISNCPTSMWPWVRAFGLASCGAGSILGASQEGLSGAVLGLFVGGIIGLFTGLLFGSPFWLVGWLAKDTDESGKSPP